MQWDDIIKKSEISKTTPKQILREDMQKTILTSFSQEGFFEKIVFQGGTALRLFYNNPRFSEGIDLVYRKDIKKTTINIASLKIKKFIEENYSFLNNIKFTSQKDDQYINRTNLKTYGDNPSQNIQINIELAKVPSYHNQPRILEFPPLNPAVRVEEEKEILADKITALGCRSYIKGRDLWDIYFLIKEKNLSISWDLVQKKVKDYNFSTEHFNNRLKEKKEEIKKNGEKVLSNELKRFLAQSVYQQYVGMFKEILTIINEKISKIL